MSGFGTKQTRNRQIDKSAQQPITNVAKVILAACAVRSPMCTSPQSADQRDLGLPPRGGGEKSHRHLHRSTEHAGGPKFKYKLAWMKRLLAHAAELHALDAPVVLAGDFNVVPTDADIYPTKSYAKNALVQPEPRALFRRILDQGWIDAIRRMHPDAPMYTFWDYNRNRWERDAGLRLDHLLLNAKAAKRLVDAGVDREVRGLEGASDHAPAWVVLSDKPAVRRKAVPRSKQPSRRLSARRTEGSAELPASRSWSSTGIHSRIALITRCLKQFWAAVANLPEPSLASPICCCAFTGMSSRVRCLWPGIR